MGTDYPKLSTLLGQAFAPLRPLRKQAYLSTPRSLRPAPCAPLWGGSPDGEPSVAGLTNALAMRGCSRNNGGRFRGGYLPLTDFLCVLVHGFQVVLVAPNLLRD